MSEGGSISPISVSGRSSLFDDEINKDVSGSGYIIVSVAFDLSGIKNCDCSCGGVGDLVFGRVAYELAGDGKLDTLASLDA